MAFSPEILDVLEALTPGPWSGTVFRHMLGDYPPTLENTRGARWNPRDVAAIYTSCERETALAEAEYSLSVQPVPLRTRRTIYRLRVALVNVLDLCSEDTLAHLGLHEEQLAGISYDVCQEVGGAVAWLGHDGLLVPSARRLGGTNLVIYPTGQDTETELDILDQESVGGTGGG